MAPGHSKYWSQVTERKATGLNCHHSQIWFKGVAVHWDGSPVAVSFGPFAGAHGNSRIAIDQKGQRDGQEHVDAIMQLASSHWLGCFKWCFHVFWGGWKDTSISNPWIKGNEHFPTMAGWPVKAQDPAFNHHAPRSQQSQNMFFATVINGFSENPAGFALSTVFPQMFPLISGISNHPAF